MIDFIKKMYLVTLDLGMVGDISFYSRLTSYQQNLSIPNLRPEWFCNELYTLILNFLWC